MLFFAICSALGPQPTMLSDSGNSSIASRAQAVSSNRSPLRDRILDGTRGHSARIIRLL